MSDIIVNRLLLVNKEMEYMPPINARTTVYTFLITGVTASNPRYSIAVAMGYQLGAEASDIKDIGARAENAIIRAMKDDVTKNNEKKIVVIELTNYPYITAYIDYRDQVKLHERESDQFSKDVVRVWNSQTKEQIPVIIVNIADVKHTHTGLKLLTL